MVRSAVAALALILLPGLIQAQEVHQVVGTETLWGLAQRYYNDPWKWPTIYEANRGVVEDPHLIYPGEELVIPDVAATTEVAEVVVEAVPAQPPQPPQPAQPAPEAVVEPERTVFYEQPSVSGFGLSQAFEEQRVVVPRDISYAAPWLGPSGDEPAHVGTIMEFTGADDERIVRETAFPFDRLEIEFSGPTPARGAQLLAFRIDRTIVGVGTVLVPTGVLAVSDPVPGGAVALVVDVFDRITMGDFVTLLPEFTVQPGVRATPVNTGLDATIVAFAVDRAIQETHDIAFLDQGSDRGVKVGDEYVAVWVEGTGTPPVEEGRLQVVSVHPDHSSAQIIHMRNPIFERGLRVRIDRRMP